MSLESILQLLVFPALGAVYWRVAQISERMAAGEERFRAVERRLDHVELHCERTHNP